MTRVLRAAALLALAPAALWLAVSAGGSTAGCTPGMTKINGVSARVFCGPAKATVRLGGKTFTFSGGDCERTSDYLAVNIGTVLLGTAAHKPDYFGLDVGRILGTGTPARRDGTYKGSALAVDYGGKGYAVRADQISVTLSGNRSKGTFTASLLLGGNVSGSFSC
jgi:hypothetical protein